MAKYGYEPYPPEAINELLQWYEERMDKIPHTSLYLKKDMHIPDVAFMVGQYMPFVKRHRESLTYTPQIRHMFWLREKLREMGL